MPDVNSDGVLFRNVKSNCVCIVACVIINNYLGFGGWICGRTNHDGASNSFALEKGIVLFHYKWYHTKIENNYFTNCCIDFDQVKP